MSEKNLEHLNKRLRETAYAASPTLSYAICLRRTYAPSKIAYAWMMWVPPQFKFHHLEKIPGSNGGSIHQNGFVQQHVLGKKDPVRLGFIINCWGIEYRQLSTKTLMASFKQVLSKAILILFLLSGHDATGSVTATNYFFSPW